MNATDAARELLAAAPDALFVSSLGTATSALRAASGDGPHLYLGGSMGAALAVAMGVADRRPEHEVVALLGDGELLMRADSLWSLAAIRPANLLVAVLANGRYGITGGQAIAPPRFAEVAAALGLTAVRARTDVAAAARELPRPALLELEIDDAAWPGPSPFVDPPVVRWRFERVAGGLRSG
jgi:thiamine pyrophosphate-dependent acetolactate synthase large subunit-like protein